MSNLRDSLLLPFRHPFITSILILLLAESSATAADIIIDDFSFDSGLWQAPDYQDPGSTFLISDGLLNYVTRGTPGLGTGDARYAREMLSYTSPWLIQVDLHFDSVTNDQVRLALDIELENKPDTGIVLQYERSRGSWEMGTFPVGDWPVTAIGNDQVSSATNLTLQFYFDAITKEITVSHDLNAAAPDHSFQVFARDPLTGPDAKWTPSDATRFRAKLRGGAEAGTFIAAGQATFDNWLMITDPLPRTNEVSADGTKAFSRIQNAIDRSRPGDMVLVYPGTYQENIDFKGRNITVSSLFSLTRDPSLITNTVVQGQASAYIVTIASGESRAQLIGFTLTNGPASASAGGIRIGLNSRATVDHCHLIGHRNGVNVDVANAASTIRSCSFTSHTGPAITVQQAPLSLLDCAFVGNRSTPAAVVDCFTSAGLIDIRHCLFVSNRCSRVLAVPRQTSNSPSPSDQAQVINCTFYGNTVTIAPITTPVPCVVLNSILFDIASTQLSGGVVSADYNMIRGGAAALQAQGVAGLFYGTNNISDPKAFPVFIGADGIPAADSRTIGAGIAVWSRPGQPAVLTTGPGESSPNPPDSAPDIGAIELPYAGPLSFVLTPTRVSGRYEEALSVVLGVDNDPQEFSYSNLPIGLEGGITSGVISGLPSQVGGTNATITVKNRWGISTNRVEFVIEKGLPPILWSPPESVTWGSALDKTVVYNAASALPGVFAFEPSLGTILDTGTHTLEVTFTPFDPDRYETVILRRQISVTRAPQQIDFNPTSTVVLGDLPLTLTASASSGLAVQFEVVSGPGALTGNILRLTGGGTVTLQAQQPGDDRYAAAEAVTRSIDVLLRPTIVQKEGGTVLRAPSAEMVHLGDTLTLTAIPDIDFTFDSWKGDISSRDNPLSLVVTNNVRLEPVFTAKWKFALTSTPGGSCLVEPPLAQIQNGARVTLTAVAEPGYAFYSWTGSLSGQINPVSFNLNTNMDVTAVFKRVLLVTVETSSGGKVTINPASNLYFEGDPLSVSAQPDEGYRFTGWSGTMTGKESPLALVLTNNLSIRATFQKLQMVRVTHSGQGAVTVLNGAYHSIGEGVTVQAQAAAGWGFAGWTGTITNAENPLTVVVGTNTALNAVFKPLFMLSAKAGPGGSVQVLPGQPSYLEGSVVTLLATPGKHYAFAGWEGAVTGTNATLSFSVMTNAVIEATFSPRHQLSVRMPQDFSQGFRLQLEAEDGVRYLIEVSSGLQAWTTLELFTHQSGQSEYLDRQAKGLSRRFYRLSPQD